MQEQQFVPGPRQRIDEITFNDKRGKLVWQHGPAFFLPDDGSEPIVLYRADFGGAGSRDVTQADGTTKKESYSYMRVQASKDGPTVSVPHHGSGDDHARWYSPLFGEGWLVMEGDLRRNGWWMRFEDLDGNVKVRFDCIELAVGRPAYVEKSQRSRSSKVVPYEDPDEPNWATYKSRSGDVFSFRRHCAPPPAGTFIKMRPHEYRTLSPKARKAYDAAKLAHEQGKTIVTDSGSTGQLSLPIRSDS